MPFATQPGLGAFLSLKDIDTADYMRGYQAGVAGKPDPMGTANFAEWSGWREGAIKAKRLPYINVFHR